jgi:hypothetical protein
MNPVKHSDSYTVYAVLCNIHGFGLVPNNTFMALKI